jgi:hypothetical protein
MHCMLYLVSHICTYALDDVQAELESDSRGASSRGYGGPRVPSVVDANIVVIKASPGASNQCPCLLF